MTSIHAGRPLQSAARNIPLLIAAVLVFSLYTACTRPAQRSAGETEPDAPSAQRSASETEPDAPEIESGPETGLASAPERLPERHPLSFEKEWRSFAPSPIVPLTRAELFNWAVALNDLGMEAYTRRDYVQAVSYFRKAIVADAQYILPHYNLACTLALMYRNGDAVDLEEIKDELTICLMLDPARAGRSRRWIYQRLAEDSDLDSLRDMEFFKKLPSISTERRHANTADWLYDLTWSSLYTDYYFDSEITIYRNNTFLYTYAPTAPQSEEYEGTWTWDANDESIHFSIKTDQSLPVKAYFNSQELTLHVILQTQDLSGEFFEVFLAADPEDHLYKAMENGDVITVMDYLEAGFPIHRYHGFWSTFYYAVNRHIALARVLAGYGAEVFGEDLLELKKWNAELYEMCMARNIKRKYSDTGVFVDTLLANKVEPPDLMNYIGGGAETDGPRNELQEWNRLCFLGWTRRLPYGLFACLNEAYDGKTQRYSYSINIINNASVITTNKTVKIVEIQDGGAYIAKDNQTLKDMILANIEKIASVMEENGIVLHSGRNMYPPEYRFYERLTTDDNFHLRLNQWKDSFEITMNNEGSLGFFFRGKTFTGKGRILGWNVCQGIAENVFIAYIEQQQTRNNTVSINIIPLSGN
jgi:hypothetical protein